MLRQSNNKSGLYNIYKAISKFQYGVSQVNQLPWHYSEKLANLKKDLLEISSDNYFGELKSREDKLMEGLVCDDNKQYFPVVTEMNRSKWSNNITKSNQGCIT